jgi:hypothetical protein
VIITTHGWEDRNGTLKVAWTDAIAPVCQVRRLRADTAASEVAISEMGSRHGAG